MNHVARDALEASVLEFAADHARCGAFVFRDAADHLCIHLDRDHSFIFASRMFHRDRNVASAKRRMAVTPTTQEQQND